MKLRKELIFGFTLMALIIAVTLYIMPAPSQMTNAHLGLLMLSMIVVAIMLGFPTAFTLMGMGVIFTWLAYRSADPDLAVQQTLDLMVQKGAYATMTNDVLISVPLFVFMGYLVERAALIEKLFKSLHLALSFVPGSLAVATLATCALFATATGIIGAVVTLMGLLAFPAMLRSRYDVKLSAGVITAGGCLGILIPPSVLLILYGATAGVSVVQLYAGAFFPGLMLAGLYVLYVIGRAILKPSLAPKPPEEETRVTLPPYAQTLSGGRRRLAIPTLFGVLGGRGSANVSKKVAGRQLGLALLPTLAGLVVLFIAYRGATVKPVEEVSGLVEFGSESFEEPSGEGVQEPQGPGVEEPQAEGVQEPPVEGQQTAAAGSAPEPGVGGIQEPPGAHSQSEPSEKSGASGVQEPPGAGSGSSARSAEEPGASGVQEPQGAGSGSATKAAEEPGASGVQEPGAAASASAPAESGGARTGIPTWFWIIAIGVVAGLALQQLSLTFERLEVFKMLLGSFFPLSMLIVAVLGAIIFGWATPTEAAALGAAGGMALAGVYRKFTLPVLKESVFLTAKTTAMVCWLFVGSSIFSAAFALLGGQALIEQWVVGLNMTPIQFMILAQLIIFFLGWPLEWTEIIVIFMPIFLPLLGHFNVDPLFFGLLVALNLQTAFLSPPVAMAAFYLKGVSPPHVSLNQIFGGMMPFMAIQVVALVLLYVFPALGLWLPRVMYK
jgi:TRAP-type mannitol/chloroaromatic compound transport system permease large subunit